MEDKEKYIVFIIEGEDWVQESIELGSFEQADSFCEMLRRQKLSYLICKIIKQGYNGK